jgi:hypothetical protein
MNMGVLRSKSQFIDFIASFIWHVTAGHKLLGDNVPFFSDPEYSGTRMVDLNNKGELPRIVDVGTYVFGTSVGSLTSTRCPPLMADWMPLYSHLVAQQTTMTEDEKQLALREIEDIHKSYKFDLFDLAVDFLDESSKRPHNRRSNALNPATHASSVSV